MTLEKRNPKMQITQQRLNQIILEEYIKEEGLDEALSPEKTAELLAWIRGQGPRPKWATDDYGSSGLGKGMQSTTDSNVDRSADTMPFGPSDIPSDDAPERDVSGFQDRAGPPLEDQLMDLIQGLPPEEVADLFQAVFEKIPGVEMGPPEEEPETLYTPGAEGRPQISLGPLREAVFAKLMEAGGTMYRGMGAAYKRDEEDATDEDIDTDEDTEETEEDV
tara:strand:+ start:3059 stop:3718 length:660 start_codon:yes stop_codon:yes gene_type:complete